MYQLSDCNFTSVTALSASSSDGHGLEILAIGSSPSFDTRPPAVIYLSNTACKDKFRNAAAGKLSNSYPFPASTQTLPLADQMHLPASEKNLGWMEARNLMAQTLLARFMVITIFLAATASLGFGQSANNSAASLYKTNCVSCHGPDGRGSAVGKSLNAADFHSAQVQQQSDAQLAGVIAEGRGNMPPFGTRLSKDQIAALVKYIRTLGKAK
jgi:cytochrome c6